MKKYLVIGLILCASLMSGCSEKVTITTTDTGNSQVKINTERGHYDKNLIFLTENVVFDERTEICYYYISEGGNNAVFSPFYSKDKQLVTKDEFIKNYMK